MSTIIKKIGYVNEDKEVMIDGNIVSDCQLLSSDNYEEGLLLIDNDLKNDAVFIPNTKGDRIAILEVYEDVLTLIGNVNMAIPSKLPYPNFATDKSNIIDKINEIKEGLK